MLPSARLSWRGWIGGAERLGTESSWLVSRLRDSPAGRRIRSVISGPESVQETQPAEYRHVVGSYCHRSSGHPFPADDRNSWYFRSSRRTRAAETRIVEMVFPNQTNLFMERHFASHRHLVGRHPALEEICELLHILQFHRKMDCAPGKSVRARVPLAGNQQRIADTRAWPKSSPCPM